MIILKSDELVAVLLGYGDLTKWYRTLDALHIPERLTGSISIFGIDWLMNKGHLKLKQRWLSSPIQSNPIET